MMYRINLSIGREKLAQEYDEYEYFFHWQVLKSRNIEESNREKDPMKICKYTGVTQR